MKSQKCAENSKKNPNYDHTTECINNIQTHCNSTTAARKNTHFFVQKFINKIKLALN